MNLLGGRRRSLPVIPMGAARTVAAMEKRETRTVKRMVLFF